MKKIITAAFLVACFSNVLLGQTNITIGQNTLINMSIPIEPYYGYTYSQSIYLASEIGTSGTISGISWQLNNTSPILENSDEWTIYIAHTSKPSFTSSEDWVTVSNLTQVYSGTSLNAPDAGGWIYFDITDFEYNGKNNLIIAVDENASGYDDPSQNFYCSSTSSNRSLTYINDDNNPDPTNISESGSILSNISNLRLSMIVPLGGAPENVTIVATSSQPVISWNPVSGAFYYKVYSSVVPYSTFPTGWTLENAHVTGTTWTDTSGMSSKKFYVVIAAN